MTITERTLTIVTGHLQYGQGVGGHICMGLLTQPIVERVVVGFHIKSTVIKRADHLL